MISRKKNTSLILQHAARGSASQDVHFLGRLLVSRLHPVRVPLRELSLSFPLRSTTKLTTMQGFPPFSGSSPEETWANLKNWPKVLRRPVYDRPEDLIFNLSDPAWDAVLQ